MEGKADPLLAARCFFFKDLVRPSGGLQLSTSHCRDTGHNPNVLLRERESCICPSVLFLLSILILTCFFILIYYYTVMMMIVLDVIAFFFSLVIFI